MASGTGSIGFLGLVIAVGNRGVGMKLFFDDDSLNSTLPATMVRSSDGDQIGIVSDNLSGQIDSIVFDDSIDQMLRYLPPS